MAFATIKWNGDEAKRIILKDANNRLSAVGRHLRDAVKKNISIPSYTGKKQFDEMDEDGTPASARKSQGTKANGGESDAKLWNDFQHQSKGKFKGKNRSKAGAAWKAYKAKRRGK